MDGFRETHVTDELLVSMAMSGCSSGTERLSLQRVLSTYKLPCKPKVVDLNFEGRTGSIKRNVIPFANSTVFKILSRDCCLCKEILVCFGQIEF